jgi:catechol 2,3-dioxygenase-like lactoylglutathione lyase family enzyme
VQHERQPLGRRQRVEHHEQRQPDRVGEHRVALRVGVVRALVHVAAERLGGPGTPGAQHVQADPRDHRRQPAGEVADVGGVRTGQPQPRLLDRVVGLAGRAEHAVGDRAQVRTVGLETLRHPVHRSRSPAGCRHRRDGRHAAGVTRRRRMNPYVSAITLGVADLARAKRFYADGLGWPVAFEQGEWVAFATGEGSPGVGLLGRAALAGDAGVPAEGSGFSGMTLSYLVRSEERVAEVLAEAERAGGTVVKPLEKPAWGGASGYFADPDGHLWKVASGPGEQRFAE